MGKVIRVKLLSFGYGGGTGGEGGRLPFWSPPDATLGRRAALAARPKMQRGSDMRIALAAAAAGAAVLTAAPAFAEVTIHSGHPSFHSGVILHEAGGSDHGDRHRHRHGRGDAFFAGWYDSDIGENRSWRSDSYNDWWHDRPGRAFPRWMSDNQDCKRLWWSGGGWRC
jgi:hypothetical protein